MKSAIKKYLFDNWTVISAIAAIIVWICSTFAWSGPTEARLDRQSSAIMQFRSDMSNGFDKLNDKIDKQTDKMIEILERRK